MAAPKVIGQLSMFLKSPCLRCQSLLQQSVRTTMTFKRLTPPSNHAPVPHLERRSLLKRHNILTMLDNTHDRPEGEMTVILKYDVEGLGMKGDVITVKKRVARSVLFPAEVADYASPENLAQNEEEMKNMPKRERRSVWSQKTVRMLKSMHLPICMNPDQRWTLTKARVRIAFRQEGLILDEQSIQLPDTPISEYGPFTVKVTVNKKDVVEVSGTVYEWTQDGSKRPDQPVWNHEDVTLEDIVVDVMRKNNLIKGPEKTRPQFPEREAKPEPDIHVLVRDYE